jgi:thiol-disulfide isomerase/thioredoxin/mono/diheme cytochrome c family protein
MFRPSHLPMWIVLPGIFLLCPPHVSGASEDLPQGRSVKVGSAIPDLRFTDIRGLTRSLFEFGERKAVVLTFTTTTCPLVRRSFPKLVELESRYREAGVQFAAVNVGANETLRDMAAQAIDFKVPFPFVKDYDLSCARALGITRSPEVVILDANRTLRYRGRIDDQFRIGGIRPEASRNDLEEALKEVLAGQPVTEAETPVDGCLISELEEEEADSNVTWSQGIGDLIHQKCVGCHRPGTAAPFSLLTLEDVKATAAMIAEVVRNETMPPWYANHAHGQFQNDASLTGDENRMLQRWIADGCPPGDLSSAPESPVSPEQEWRIGEPDLVITMFEEHTVPASGFVPYRYSVLPYVFLNETWVEAFEIKPDNPAVVHHCNMAYITKDGAGEDTFITGYVPGGQAMDLGRFQNGTAYRIPQGSGLGLQIHFTTTGKEERCRIRVGLRFPRRTVNKQLRHFLLDPRGWRIPPHDPAFRLEASHTLDRDISLLGMFTHMHVRGRDMTFLAESRQSPPEILLQIPNYNFEWQLGYEIEPGRKQLAQGTVIRAVAHFDNSEFNPYNPDPNATVRYGPQTVDEMFNGFVFFVDSHESLNLKVDPSNGTTRDVIP